jgi:hypothetical protein
MNDEIKNANRALFSVVVSELSSEGIAISYSDFASVILDNEYKAFISGWLLSKGFEISDLDLTKETNITNV